MLGSLCNLLMYSLILVSLFVIDYTLGNGFADSFQICFCKIVCFVRRSLREEDKHQQLLLDAAAAGRENTVSLPIVFGELTVLSLTIIFLKRYQQMRGKDRIDELLQESKEALRQTNEFLEKWRLRRLNWQLPSEFNYLDEEPQEIKPLKLEVPILHMAIIDTRATARNNPESGDAGDAIKVTDSTLLSMSSLIDDDFDTVSESIYDERAMEEPQQKTVDFRSRLLWDVMEEDANLED